MAKIKDLAGKISGRLTVIKHVGMRNGKALWLCQCQCGNTKIVRSENLVTGNTRSCGCLKRDVSKENVKAMHRANVRSDACLNRVWSYYRWNARRSEVPFTLEKIEFARLLATVCFYCDAEPDNLVRAESGDTLRYNGIDRLVPANGYVSGNCVPCCKICNFMKNTLSVEEFFAHISKIADKLTKCTVRG